MLEYLRWADYNRYYEIVEEYKINVDHQKVNVWNFYRGRLPRYGVGKGDQYSV